MSRPLFIDPKTGDREELPTCDLCGSTRKVQDDVVGGYGSPVHTVLLDLCEWCCVNEWDKAEWHAGQVIDRRKAALPDDVKQHNAHLQRMGKIPHWPPRPLPDWRACRTCGAPACSCDREPRPLDDESRERRLQQREGL